MDAARLLALAAAAPACLGSRLLLEALAAAPTGSRDEGSQAQLAPGPSGASFPGSPAGAPAPRRAPFSPGYSGGFFLPFTPDTSFSSPSAPPVYGYSTGYYWHFPYWSILFIFLAITSILVGALVVRKRQLARANGALRPPGGPVGGVTSYPPPYTASHPYNGVGYGTYGRQAEPPQPQQFWVPMTEAYVPYQREGGTLQGMAPPSTPAAAGSSQEPQRRK